MLKLHGGKQACAYDDTFLGYVLVLGHVLKRGKGKLMFTHINLST